MPEGGDKGFARVLVGSGGRVWVWRAKELDVDVDKRRIGEGRFCLFGLVLGVLRKFLTKRQR